MSGYREYSLTHLTILGKCTNPMLQTIGDTSPLLRLVGTDSRYSLIGESFFLLRITKKN